MVRVRDETTGDVIAELSISRIAPGEEPGDRVKRSITVFGDSVDYNDHDHSGNDSGNERGSVIHIRRH